tara:strand:- start:34818 stop:35666 length:849 start_codon:yes stop_codon:yes gene_type:complete
MKLFTLKRAKHKTNNIIYNSPHSGEHFPSDFFEYTSIDKHTLLCSGDSFVDKLFSEASNNGSVFLCNEYARSFMDTNREAYELDPEMYSEEITKTLVSDSAKVKMGFGSIAKFAYTRKHIYDKKIPFSDALKRIDDYYHPIHEKLNELLNTDFEKYGYSLLVDCHSMPSYEFLGQPSAKYRQPDIILGNLHGKSCSNKITDYLTRHFMMYDLSVAHNTPFAGGFNTSHYGDPRSNHHAVQIEIKKSLYMDEITRKPNEHFEPIKIIMSSLCDHLAKDIDKLL